MRTYITDLPPNTHLVRVAVGDGPEYDRMVVATEEDGGETLFLQGWVGEFPTRGHWLAVREERFPRAIRVRFIRRNRQHEREVVINLPALPEMATRMLVAGRFETAG